MAEIAVAPAWTAQSHDDYEQLRDLSVFSNDGENLGNVTAVFHPDSEAAGVPGNHCLAVMPGVLRNLFGADVAYVPESAIARVDSDGIHLNVPADCVDDQGWNSQPPGTACIDCS